MKKVLNTLSRYFRLAEDCEITLVGNAEDFTSEKCAFIAGSIINRVSLGAQSFQPDVLRTVGSPHKATQTIDAIRMLQVAGLEHISLDMMYNMPGHTVEDWRKDFVVLRDLGIKHLITYFYRVTPGSQQDKLIKAGKVNPVADPESGEVHQMQAMITQSAEEAGMSNYMLEHYAMPGFESKYNHYTMRECVDALGVGAVAYSFINQRRTGTSKDVERYIAAVEDCNSTFTTASIQLTPLMSRQRHMIFNLLCYRADKDRYAENWGGNPRDDFPAIIDVLLLDRLIRDDGNAYVVTDLGRSWLQNIMLEFFDESMWENSIALQKQQSSWAINDHMIALGAAKKTHWLEKA